MGPRATYGFAAVAGGATRSVRSAIPIRALTGVLLVMVLAALAGCATPRSPRAGELLPHEKPGAPRSVAVVVLADIAADAAGGVEPNASAVGTESAAAGAQGGAAMVAATAPIALATGATALLGPLAVVGASIAIVGRTFGDLAIASLQRKAVELDTATQVESMRSSLAPTIARDMAAVLPAVANVPSGLVAAGGGYDARALRGKGYGSALEVQGASLRFVAGRRLTTEDVAYSLVHTMHARLVDTYDGRVVALRGLVIVSPMRFASDWTRNGSALARREAERGNRTLAEAAVEALVLRVDLASPSASSNCGVELLQPKSAWTFLDGWSVADAGSLAPTLVWSARPAIADGPHLPDGARDFRYDIRVWRVVEGEVDQLVFERLGIEETTLSLPEGLEPGSVYGWSVRARYAVDGRTRAERWSALPAPVAGSAWWYSWSTWTTDASGTTHPAPCPHERYFQACGCCDYLPASALRKFRTP